MSRQSTRSSYQPSGRGRDRFNDDRQGRRRDASPGTEERQRPRGREQNERSKEKREPRKKSALAERIGKELAKFDLLVDDDSRIVDKRTRDGLGIRNGPRGRYLAWQERGGWRIATPKKLDEFIVALRGTDGERPLDANTRREVMDILEMILRDKPIKEEKKQSVDGVKPAENKDKKKNDDKLFHLRFVAGHVGSGKSTAHKKGLAYDVDESFPKQQNEDGTENEDGVLFHDTRKRLFDRAVKTGDWKAHNAFITPYILDWLKTLQPGVVLLHGENGLPAGRKLDGVVVIDEAEFHKRIADFEERRRNVAPINYKHLKELAVAKKLPVYATIEEAVASVRKKGDEIEQKRAQAKASGKGGAAAPPDPSQHADSDNMEQSYPAPKNGASRPAKEQPSGHSRDKEFDAGGVGLKLDGTAMEVKVPLGLQGNVYIAKDDDDAVSYTRGRNVIRLRAIVPSDAPPEDVTKAIAAHRADPKKPTLIVLQSQMPST